MIKHISVIEKVENLYINLAKNNKNKNYYYAEISNKNFNTSCVLNEFVMNNEDKKTKISYPKYLLMLYKILFGHIYFLIYALFNFPKKNKNKFEHLYFTLIHPEDIGKKNRYFQGVDKKSKKTSAYAGFTISLKESFAMKSDENVFVGITFLNIFDIFVAFSKAIFFKINFFNIYCSAKSQKYDLRISKISVFKNLLKERAAYKLIKHYGPSVVYLQYENNIWERAIINAANELGVKVFGYYHCAIKAGEFKNNLYHDEIGQRPLPDKLFFNGTSQMDSLKKLGCWDKIDLKVCGTIRGSDINYSQKIVKPNKIKKVLFLFSGNQHMDVFLKWIDKVAEINKNIDFEYREHPLFPIEKLIKNIDLKKLFVKKSTGNLDVAIANADIVGYYDTTSIFGAISYGKIPVYCTGERNLISYDPLFMQDNEHVMHCKHVIDFSNIISEIENMSDEKYKNICEENRNFCKSYYEKFSADKFFK